jgi:hypothetical protein
VFLSDVKQIAITTNSQKGVTPSTSGAIGSKWFPLQNLGIENYEREEPGRGEGAGFRVSKTNFFTRSEDHKEQIFPVTNICTRFFKELKADEGGFTMFMSRSKRMRQTLWLIMRLFVGFYSLCLLSAEGSNEGHCL